MSARWIALVRSWLGSGIPPHRHYGTCSARHARPRSRRREVARALLARRTA